jgi:hypothetical protein
VVARGVRVDVLTPSSLSTLALSMPLWAFSLVWSVVLFGTNGVGHHSRCFSCRLLSVAAGYAVAFVGDLIGI